MNCIIASTSTVHGSEYLAYLQEALTTHFSTVQNILFIPYARPGGISHDKYTEKAQKAFHKIGKKVTGIHKYENPQKAITEAEAIFTGGGNTFVLISQLHQLQLIQPLQKTIRKGTPYLGTSAGSNICGKNVRTTNDMPIVYPQSFEALGILPFNINPHYLDPDPNSTHKGETRETRIKEFHAFNTLPVVGLREGSWLTLTEEDIMLKGNLNARIFEANQSPYEIQPGTSLKALRVL